MPLSEINQPCISTLLQRVLHFKCKEAWKGVGGGETKIFHLIIASSNNLNSDFTSFTLLMLILTGYDILRDSNQQKKLLHYCILAATYNFPVLHNQLFHI